jgi:hypothetical protein
MANPSCDPTDRLGFIRSGYAWPVSGTIRLENGHHNYYLVNSKLFTLRFLPILGRGI